MIPKRKRFFIAAGLMIMLNIAACKKENEESLLNKQGGAPSCDTADMKYSANILPIIQSNCYSCHGNGQLEGNVTLDGYNNLKLKIDNRNTLLNVIMHSPGFPPMPQGAPKLAECDINKIAAWINKGAPNN